MQNKSEHLDGAGKQIHYLGIQVYMNMSLNELILLTQFIQLLF